MSKSASDIRFSATTGGFYHTAFHADAIPADAVPVTERRHRELLAGQATGRAIITNATGAPDLAPPQRLTVARLRERAVRAVKSEARRRILAIASLERQTNDNAAIALHSLAAPADQPSDAERAEVTAAIARRKAIDAVRTASNTIEGALAGWSAAALEKYTVGDDARWPKD